MRYVFFLFFCFIVCVASGQNSFVKLTDGRCLRVKVIKCSKEGLVYRSGETEMSISADELEFAELETEGLIYFHYDSTQYQANLSKLRSIAQENPFILLEKGRKVYIPISSSRYKETLGRFDLREAIMNKNIWEVVYTPYEADFILLYYWNKDNDNCCQLEFKDRDGNLIYESVKILSNKSFRPVVESRNNIAMLEDVVIRQLEYDLVAKDIISDELINESKRSPFELLKRGRKVFCECRNFDKVSFFGTLFFRHFIEEKSYWIPVNSKKEAEFVLTFIYDENGRDHCYFWLSDRTGKIFYQSGTTNAKGEDQVFTTTQISNITYVTYVNSWFKNWEPTERAYESAKILFEKQMPVLHRLLNKRGINEFHFDFSMK